MKKIIIFLIRKRLGLKKYQYFKFTNQKTQDMYSFTNTRLVKTIMKNGRRVKAVPSGASLNWLLNSECKVHKLSGEY